MPGVGPIRVRLGATRALLDQHAGTPRHIHMSQAQSTAILAMVREAGAQLSADDRATLSEIVGNVQWFDDHGLAILRELTEVNAASGGAPRQAAAVLELHRVLHGGQLGQDARARCTLGRREDDHNQPTHQARRFERLRVHCQVGQLALDVADGE